MHSNALTLTVLPQLLKNKIDGVDCVCPTALSVSASQKNERLRWIFELRTRRVLQSVGLLHSEFRGAIHQFPRIIFNSDS
jgi:hypothetical protein